MNITTLYYVRTERPVTMQNHRVINVKVANAARILHDDLIRAARDVSIFANRSGGRRGRGRCKFHVVVALIGASEIDESS